MCAVKDNSPAITVCVTPIDEPVDPFANSTFMGWKFDWIFDAFDFLIIVSEHPESINLELLDLLMRGSSHFSVGHVNTFDNSSWREGL
jgi:hypothetical protein